MICVYKTATTYKSHCSVVDQKKCCTLGLLHWSSWWCRFQRWTDNEWYPVQDFCTLNMSTFGWRPQAIRVMVDTTMQRSMLNLTVWSKLVNHCTTQLLYQTLVAKLPALYQGGDELPSWSSIRALVLQIKVGQKTELAGLCLDWEREKKEVEELQKQAASRKGNNSELGGIPVVVRVSWNPVLSIDLEAE